MAVAAPTSRRDGTCVIQNPTPPSRAGCCCEKWWNEGDLFERLGGQACEMCLKGECIGRKH